MRFLVLIDDPYNGGVDPDPDTDSLYKVHEVKEYLNNIMDNGFVVLDVIETKKEKL